MLLNAIRGNSGGILIFPTIESDEAVRELHTSWYFYKARRVQIIDFFHLGLKKDVEDQSTNPSRGSWITFVVVCDFPENFFWLTVWSTLDEEITQHTDLEDQKHFLFHAHTHSGRTL